MPQTPSNHPQHAPDQILAQTSAARLNMNPPMRTMMIPFQYFMQIPPEQQQISPTATTTHHFGFNLSNTSNAVGFPQNGVAVSAEHASREECNDNRRKSHVSRTREVRRSRRRMRRLRNLPNVNVVRLSSQNEMNANSATLEMQELRIDPDYHYEVGQENIDLTGVIYGHLAPPAESEFGHFLLPTLQELGLENDGVADLLSALLSASDIQGPTVVVTRADNVAPAAD
ncbi:hypothetical protein BDR26DRAFT_371303 [Obelidium mucronatum]|nr:hypothetical protein BDR26DRAFT_371303 [Obelidium mucronatum]